MEPREILGQVRRLLDEHAGGDADKRWYANRFVFARLMLDERKTKTAIKKALLASGAPCHACGKPIETPTGVHLHRIDGDRGYSDENCALMHPDCHIAYHAETAKEDAMSSSTTPSDDSRVLVKQSKFYEDAPFTYWWDISPNQAEKLDRYEAVEFACKDTGLRCRVAVADLKPLLSADRQTSRGAGHWGIKVLNGHEDELAFEPPTGSQDWRFLTAEWV